MISLRGSRRLSLMKAASVFFSGRKSSEFRYEGVGNWGEFQCKSGGIIQTVAGVSTPVFEHADATPAIQVFNFIHKRLNQLDSASG